MVKNLSMTMVTSYKPENGYCAPTLGFPELQIPEDSRTMTKTGIQNLNFSIPV